MSELSDRLFRQLHQARARNLRATLAMIDAAAMPDAAGEIPPTDGGTVDRFVREHVEGATCWRDPRSGSPAIRRSARP